MTVTVTAPNGATVDFPDGTDHDTINSVMSQNFDPAPPKTSTFDFTSPEGKRYTVQGPHGSTPEQAFQILQTQIDPAPHMPTFEIAGPDGGKYHLNAPDEHAAVDAWQAFQNRNTSGKTPDAMPAPAAQGSSLTGVAKSLGTGLAEGAIGLAGMIPDISAAAHSAADKYLFDPLLNATIGKPSNPAVERTFDPSKAFGSAGIQKAVEGVTGEFYKPQGAAENIANKIGQFAPAMIGGPESLATKALTRVAAPAVASEAAGKLTEGTAAQPYAELGGALVGAGGMTAGMRKFQELVAARAAAKLVPTTEDIKAASRGLYQHPDVAAVQIHPAAVSDLADTITTDLQHGPNSGFRPANEPKVFSAVDELNTAAKENRPATVADIDSVRQVLGGLAKERDAIGQPTRQAAAAFRAIDQVNDFLPNLKQPDLLAGNAAKANDILGEARANWAAFKKSSQVQNLAGNAELNAASSHSGANIQNATRQAFKPLLKNDAAKVASWTDEEKDALNKIVRGTWTGNAARAAGNVLGGGGGLGMLLGAGAGYEGGGIPGAIAGAAAGRALKMIGNRSTLNAVDHLDTLIRSRSPEAMRIAAQNPQIVQALPPESVHALRNMIFVNPALRALNQPSGTIGQSNTE
jgi:hypothetical protein